MQLTAGAPVEIARVGQHGQAHDIAARVTQLVPAQRFLGEHIQLDALDAAGRSLEAALDDLFAQADGLEDLCTLVGLQRRDADLGHDFEHALDHALAVVGHDGIVVGILVGGQQTVALGLEQCFKSQVGVDRIGAVADEQAVVVNLARFAGLATLWIACANIIRAPVIVRGTGACP